MVQAAEVRQPVNMPWSDMSALLYVLLTVAIFALLALVQRLVERQ